MGRTLPNMSIYVPEDGEELYSEDFLEGMENVDAHRHTGAPNDGAQIGTAGIEDGAITPDKLSFTVFTEATLQTTDATPSNIASIAVDEGVGVAIEGFIYGHKADGTAMLWGGFVGGFRRQAGGNVVAVDSPVLNQGEDFSGSPSYNLVANTGDQSVKIQVTGLAATTINWKVRYEAIATA